MEKEAFKVWIVKYALTKGIYEIEVEDRFNISPTMVVTKGKCSHYFHEGDWFYTKEEAIEKANDMQRKKIDSLTKQIIKLSKIKFE